MIMVVIVGTDHDQGVVLVGGLGSLLDGDRRVIRLQPMPYLPLPPTSRSCFSMTLGVPCWDKHPGVFVIKQWDYLQMYID